VRPLQSSRGDGIRSQTRAPAVADPWGSSFAGSAVREQPSPLRAGSFVKPRTVRSRRARPRQARSFTADDESLPVRSLLAHRSHRQMFSYFLACQPYWRTRRLVCVFSKSHWKTDENSLASVKTEKTGPVSAVSENNWLRFKILKNWKICNKIL
jgi:hypothetical protein